MISSGKRYSSPACPKLTRISCRPMFSIARTNVPSRGSTIPVFCDLMGLLVFSGSPVFIVVSHLGYRLLLLISSPGYFVRSCLFVLSAFRRLPQQKVCKAGFCRRYGWDNYLLKLKNEGKSGRIAKVQRPLGAVRHAELV